MQSMKYVLFGAGQIGKSFLDLIGQENVLCFVDNDPLKAGTEVSGIKVCDFNDVCSWLQDKCIVISMSHQKKNEIITQLKRNSIESFIYYEDLQKEILKKKIKERMDYINVYHKTIKWIQNNTINDQGIINNTELRKPYPEVTGYFIPSLLCWGYRDLALSYAKWLCNIQKEDGSWYDTEDKNPYIFDTGQIIKGLIAIRGMYPQVDMHIKKGCAWILSNMQDDGRLPSPRKHDFGDEKTYAEIIHIYCLAPIVEAGNIYGIPEFKEKAYKILDYYKENAEEKILNFSLLSHFYAYVLEGLLDLGEDELARKAMERIENLQNENGAVPGYANTAWVCSTGLFQLALIWFRLGNITRGNKAFEYACKLQNMSGGWFGSYLTEDSVNEKNTYFPSSEISWAAKYFLDALYWKNRAVFENQAPIFKDVISVEDGRYQVVETIIKSKTGENQLSSLILDVGCGKGAYLKNLINRVPQAQYFAVDISLGVMKYLQYPGIDMKQGTLTNIPYNNGFFDVVYSCEALEHAIDIESAIKEMARVTKSGGTIAIIDKNEDKLGFFEIGECEQWFGDTELSSIMHHYCSKVEVIKNVGYEGLENGLFCAWLGKVN